MVSKNRLTDQVRCFLLLSLLLTMIAFPQVVFAQESLKVAFVYNGSPDATGWDFRHEKGRQYLVEQLGNQIETTTVEQVPAGADSARVFRQLANRGFDLIFGTSFGYMDPMLKVSKDYPETVFLNADGFKTGENMGNYSIRVYQSSFLSGIVAGHHVDEGPVGYIAPHPVPSTMRQINAFALGLRKIKPDATVKVVWTNAWHDPAKSKSAANSLIEAGAELIAQYTDSPAPVQTASENNIPSIGFYTDMSEDGPNSFLTSPIMNWGPYYVEVTKQVMNGTWKPGSYWEGMHRGLTYLAPYTEKVKKQAMRKVSRYQAKMLAGEMSVFEGPIRDQEGKLRVKKGNQLSREKLFGLDWLIQGVEGSIP